MKAFCIVLMLFFPVAQNIPGLYVCSNVKADLYSEAPLENIDATSVKGFSVLNTSTSEIQFNIPIRSFQFKKSLMQEHFNENYMESDKFPNARFKGKINEAIDFSKNGDYPITVSGDLEVHGIKKSRTINGTVKVKDKVISISSKFNVLCKDHNITIPRLVFKNVAENIRITVTGNFSPNQVKP